MMKQQKREFLQLKKKRIMMIIRSLLNKFSHQMTQAIIVKAEKILNLKRVIQEELQIYLMYQKDLVLQKE